MRTLVIGDKRWSSWSMRPWLALKQGGIAFDEHVVRLRRPDTRAQIAAVSPSGKVPLLIDGELTIWDSLAICEWAAERVPSLWPSDPSARAIARSVSAEMHSSFVAMRTEMSMDVELRTKKELSPEARADADRVMAIWRETRAKWGQNGDFLFGAFSIADCFYAPVVTRFRSYGVALDDTAARYSEAIFAHPHVRAWCDAAERD
ncbi:glutathione S-transferase family protein [Sandaracinus amylolyticus]|nr:glutathione S-transferase family protein [Sandaracinus amylolyticus]